MGNIAKILEEAVSTKNKLDKFIKKLQKDGVLQDEWPS